MSTEEVFDYHGFNLQRIKIMSQNEVNKNDLRTRIAQN